MPSEDLPGAHRRRLDDGSEDQLIREDPLLIQIEDQQLVTMRTPGDDEALATGFLLTEGVIDSPLQVTSTHLVPEDREAQTPDTIHLRVAPGLRQRVAGRLARTHEIRSSCGLCGLSDPDELLEDLPPLLTGVPRLDEATITTCRERFEAEQTLFRATGACHAAALFGHDGELWALHEDVGRHNALDKVIGQCARERRDLTHAIAFLSGRAGSDLVLKCLRVRIGVILSVSATSALSFDMCKAAGATLIGFVRENRIKVYLQGGRMHS